METRPPRLIEAIIGKLIPPVCRETVLGDLYERYTSTPRYITEAIEALPFIVASQIRRTSPVRLILAQLFVLYVATAGASLAAGPSYIYDHAAWLPLGVAIGSVVLVLMICDAYTDPRRRSKLTELRNVIVALGITYYSQAAIGLILPHWTLPLWVLLLGDVLSFNMLLIVRRQYKPISQHTVTAGAVTMSLDELNRRSQREHRNAWRLNLSWIAVAFAVLVTNWNPLPPSGRTGLIVLFLLLVGVFSSFHKFRHGKVGQQQRLASSITASWNTHRIDLIGMRDGLDLWSGARTRWDLGGPPALLIVLIAFPFFLLLLGLFARQPFPESVGTPFWWRSLAALLLLIVTWIFLRRVNDRAARTIEKELDALDTSTKDDDSDHRPS